MEDDSNYRSTAGGHGVRIGSSVRRFPTGRSVPPAVFEKLHAILKEDEAVEEILSLRAIYSGPEEVLVMAKVRPSAQMTIEKLSRAMDDLDRKIRQEFPVVADVFIDITANRAREHSRTRLGNE